jgi:hypothetical protein
MRVRVPVVHVHAHPLYLECPGLPRAVGETSYGIRVWFIESHVFFAIYLLICICGAKFTLNHLSKQNHILPKEKKTSVASLQK